MLKPLKRLICSFVKGCQELSSRREMNFFEVHKHRESLAKASDYTFGRIKVHKVNLQHVQYDINDLEINKNKLNWASMVKHQVKSAWISGSLEFPRNRQC